MDFIYQYNCIPVIPHGSPLRCMVSPWFPILFFHFFDVLHGLDAPPASVGGPVDAEFDLPSLLNHPVVAG